MEYRTRAIIIVALAGLTLLGGAWYFFSHDFAARADERRVRSLVADFGARPKKVSLLSPEASSTIAAEYSAYVSPELIALWQKDPAQAPGRRTSSPWPDRIEITEIMRQGAGYIVQGAIILMTSEEAERGGNAGIIPVYLQIVRQDGAWKIVAYQEVATSTPAR